MRCPEQTFATSPELWYSQARRTGQRMMKSWLTP
jgi:hypothetical protein